MVCLGSYSFPNIFFYNACAKDFFLNYLSLLRPTLLLEKRSILYYTITNTNKSHNKINVILLYERFIWK